jgi:site-specific DNA recombinase
MPSTNGHGPKRVILYARVSTDEQARSGYSLAQQIEALREYAAREGYEVLEEISDPGQSGASLERPGMDRVRDLVAAGGVSVVLAQDRDRFAREPAYHYLLRREFEEHGTKIRALNDRGDDSPEGELTDGILDQLAKYERAKIVERSRRGKLRKAREGKVLAAYRPTHGFRMNAARDGYEVDEEKMAVVRRVFRMVGAEGAGIYGVHKTLEREGVPPPGGGRYWDKRAIKRWIVDDAYKPHAYEEVAELVRPEVAARLDPGRSYGIWWFNRRRTSQTQVSEPNPEGNGRVYRKVGKVAYRNKEEWIAVPIPDAGIPLEWVEAARAMLAGCRSPSSVDGRFWELSGALMRCGECGRAMEAMVKTARKKSGGRYVFCYYRCREGNRKRETCSNNRCIRSDRAHAAVWDLISGLLSEPERLRVGLEAMIEEERKGVRGDPERESKAWLQKLAEVDRKRDGYLELAAEGFLDRDELRAKLAALEETRETAERELRTLRGHSELLENLEREKDAVIENYAGLVPGALESLSPRERHQVYRMLRLKVVAHPDDKLEVSGAFSRKGLGNTDLLRM